MELHLLIPSLLQALKPDLKLPALARLFQIAKKSNGINNIYQALATLFGMSNPSVAPITYLADTKTLPQGIWMRADPVYIDLGIEQAILINADYCGLTLEEAQALIASINEQIKDFEIILGDHPTHWYIQLNQYPNIELAPLPEVIGKDIKAYLPQGEEAKVWQQWLSEIQMILYQHPVNQKREQNGQSPINNLWLWGAGILPTMIYKKWQATWAEDSFSKGLALYNNIDYYPIPNNAQEWLKQAKPGNHLLINEKIFYALIYDEIDYVEKCLLTLEKCWFKPLLQALKDKKIEKINIYPCSKHIFTISKPQFWQFLSPIQPVYNYKNEETNSSS